MQSIPDSYYMSDGAAQVDLLLGDLERAKSAFAASTMAIKRLPKQSFWSTASATTAAIAAEDEHQTIENLRKLRQMAADPLCAVAALREV